MLIVIVVLLLLLVGLHVWHILSLREDLRKREAQNTKIQTGVADILGEIKSQRSFAQEPDQFQVVSRRPPSR